MPISFCLCVRASFTSPKSRTSPPTKRTHWIRWFSSSSAWLAGLLTRCNPGTCDCGWCLVWGHAESPNDMPCTSSIWTEELSLLPQMLCIGSCKQVLAQPIRDLFWAKHRLLPAFACPHYFCMSYWQNGEPRTSRQNWRKGKLYKRWRGNIATFLLKSGSIETTIHEVPSVHDVCPLNSWQWK